MKKDFLKFRMMAKTFMIALIIGVVGKIYAYDFSAVCSTGQTLYYTITDEMARQVKLTSPLNYYNGWSGFSMPVGNIILPGRVQYEGITYSVTEIGEGAFRNCNGLTGSLTIPNSVTVIGSSAFAGCSGFNGTLTLGNSVTSIGYGTFSGCNGFTGNLTIPNSITIIGGYAFYNCSGFTGGLTIGNAVAAIGYGAFQNCSGLTGSLNIPNSVTYLEGLAFQNCSGLSGVLTIPSSLDSIGYYVFYGCNFAEVHYNALHAEYTYGWTGDTPHNFDNCSGSLVIGDNVESIPTKMFYNSGFTGNITIGTSVTSIGRFAFANCNSVAEVHFNPTNCIHCGYEETAFSGCAGSLIIGDNVTQIPGNAFIFASFNGTLSIGNSVTTIGEAAFNSCGGFTGGLVIPNSVTEIGAWAFTGAGFDGELVISNSLTTIDGGVFSGCGFTGELVIPSNVTTIEVSAFEGCNGFTGNLIIPNTINTIHQFTFAGCSGFTGCLEIPNSVTRIESMAFYGCSGLSCINIPNTVQSIGGNVFSETAWFNNQADGIIYLDGWCLGYKGNQPTGTLIFQEGTKGIAGWAFDHCYGLTGILTIPESIERMGEFAFVGCSGITELHYNAISLGVGVFDSPFMECYGLNTLVIGDNVEVIPNGIFRELSLTGNLIIPNSVTSIGEDAFYNCSGLSGNLILSDSVTSIGSYAFYGCSGFDGCLSIGDSVISIGSNAFDGCIGFTSLKIGNSVTTINSHAFNSCSGLVGDVVVPNAVRTIRASAFRNCVGIVSITLLPQLPPSLGNWAFENTNCSIYVPYESINVYNNSTNWTNYGSRIYPMSYITIPAYNEDADNWRFIASPLVEETIPTTIENLITETEYDLYQFNLLGENGEWQNYKADSFNLVNGRGYLYANAKEVNVIFKGEFNEDETKTISLTNNAASAGWNLVGNPFPVNAYINRSYYVMNENGSGINPVAVSASTPIPPCTGVFVKVEGEGETVIFTRAVP